MRINPTILLIAFSFLSESAIADYERIANAKITLAEKLNAGSTAAVKERFGSLGLAPDDLDRAIKRLVDGYAECIVDGMVTQALEQSLSVSSLLDSLDSPNTEAAKDLMTSLDLPAAEEKILLCKYTVDQEVGLVID